ncbi:glycosyltransferase family 4 protein [Pedobacter ginsengisoli]|nr:glycosyltransferase family 4 protein [Pedobacter ginsengisoli]
MNSQNVLIITYEFPPIIGGAGVYAHDMAIGLASNQCNVDIVTYNHLQESSVIKNRLKSSYDINVFDFIPRNGLHFLQFFFLIKKIIRIKEYDFIILSDGRAKKIFSVFSQSFKKEIPKSISVFHGNEINSFFVKPSRLIRFFSLSGKLKRLFSRQRLLITVSENEKQTWNKFMPELKNKIALVQHGVNENTFYVRTPDEISELKNFFGIPLGKKVLLSASRLIQMKGQDKVLDAYSRILSELSDVFLLIVGDGCYLESLKKQAESLGISNSVNFVGGVDRETLSKYYAIADLFVLPSRLEESFGLVYIEAAACGVPSISGNLGGVFEAVKDGLTGAIVDSFNVDELEGKMKYLLINNSARRELGQNALKKFKSSFTSKVMAHNLIVNLRKQ